MKASETVVTPFARLALGFSFLSAVADRFGLWGALGAPHVAWETLRISSRTPATLNWFLPRPMIPALAWLATGAEVTLGIALILGIFTAASMCSASWPATSDYLEADFTPRDPSGPF